MALFQIMELSHFGFLAPGLGNAGVASVAFCVAIATGVAVTWLKRCLGKCSEWKVGLNFENVDCSSQLLVTHILIFFFRFYLSKLEVSAFVFDLFPFMARSVGTLKQCYYGNGQCLCCCFQHGHLGVLVKSWI